VSRLDDVMDALEQAAYGLARYQSNSRMPPEAVHTLVGGLIGAGVAKAGFSAVKPKAVGMLAVFIVGFPQGTASIPDEAWQASFELNLVAAIRLTNALLPAAS
jgi:NAD(P)-dependent dehydrogenase (short-subunit alcohol dehydrogenase family)